MTRSLALHLSILPAYLLVGCMIMLTINEILDQIVTKREFLRGMVVWPVLLLVGVWEFLSHLYARYLS